MINNTFSFNRFWNYFQYDLKQLWRNNGKAVIVLGFLSVFSYLVWVIFSLIFTGEWHAPGVSARVSFFVLGWFILMLYNTRSYGYLTEKRAGSAWLMIPASTLEKFVSMMVITIIVLPLAYVVSYLLLDGAISLLDPTAGDAIVTGAAPMLEAIGEGLEAAGVAGLEINLGLFLIPIILQAIGNLLYFLLCGICFKKWKLVGAFVLLLGASMVFTPISVGLVMHGWAPMVEIADSVQAMELLNNALNWGTLLDALMVLGFGAGIYYRIKTLKH